MPFDRTGVAVFVEQTLGHTWKYSNQRIAVVVAMVVAEPIDAEPQELAGQQNVHEPGLGDQMHVVDELAEEVEKEVIV